MPKNTNTNTDIDYSNLYKYVDTMINKYAKNKVRKLAVKQALKGYKTILGYIFASIYRACNTPITTNNSALYLNLCAKYSYADTKACTSDTKACFKFTIKDNTVVYNSIVLDKVHITLVNGKQIIDNTAKDSTISKFKTSIKKAHDATYKGVWILAIQLISDYHGISAKDIISALKKHYADNKALQDLKPCDIKSA